MKIQIVLSLIWMALIGCNYAGVIHVPGGYQNPSYVIKYPSVNTYSGWTPWGSHHWHHPPGDYGDWRSPPSNDDGKGDDGLYRSHDDSLHSHHDELEKTSLKPTVLQPAPIFENVLESEDGKEGKVETDKPLGGLAGQIGLLGGAGDAGGDGGAGGHGGAGGLGGVGGHGSAGEDGDINGDYKEKPTDNPNIDDDGDNQRINKHVEGYADINVDEQDEDDVTTTTDPSLLEDDVSTSPLPISFNILKTLL